MLYASIGGMQLKSWTGYFKIIVPTLRVLRAAKQAPGCTHADTFKGGDVYFAVSVWKSEADMQCFAKSGLHGKLTSIAMDEMAMFYNHSQAFDVAPDRAQAKAAWQTAMAARDGKGTVGSYLAKT